MEWWEGRGGERQIAQRSREGVGERKFRDLIFGRVGDGMFKSNDKLLFF